MRRYIFLYLALYCLSFALAIGKNEFHEELFVKPLPSFHVYTYFQFITLVDSESSFNHVQYAPRSLGEVISRFDVEEMHLTLTEGQWRHGQWGYPVRDAAPGAELAAWFHPKVQDVDSHWRQLSAALAGMFCASLNFIDTPNTITPKMALWPTGAHRLNQNVTTHHRYASLPREIVCTENLTPWKKLLPCESQKGFSTLLNSRMIHNTNYHSLGVHFRRMCSNRDCSETHLEIKQTVSLVYDSKMLKSKDWSIRKLFGQGLQGACPLSSSSRVYVDITSNATQPFRLSPQPDRELLTERGGSETRLAVYEVEPNGVMMNIVATGREDGRVRVPVPPPLEFNRYVLGYGKELGGIVTEIQNNYWAPIDVVVMENAPWWLPLQLSSLRVDGEAASPRVLALHYAPGRSRQRPYHLELLLKLPPRSKTTVVVDFEFVFLKWQEYPPDANHGFYIGSAIILANLPTAKNYTSLPLHGSSFESLVNGSQAWYPMVFRTNGGMVSLPTPDFSMPYNVICLACTVVALAFGPLHNVCTKEVVLKPTASSSLKDKILRFLNVKKD